LAVVCQIRDEQDIVALFLAHLKALFDMVYVLDHRSVDSTREVLERCREDPSFSVYSVGMACDHQKQTAQLLLKEAFSNGADFVFFLDADEFIKVGSRTELEALVRDHENELLLLKWRLTLVESIAEEATFPTPESNLYLRLNQHELGKVAIPRKSFQDRTDFHMGLGNHIVCDLNNNNERLPVTEVGEILHLPIRNRKQCIQKLFRGALNRLSQADRIASEGWHYFEPLRILAESDLTAGQMRYIASHYSESWLVEELPEEELRGPKFESMSFSQIAFDLDVYRSLRDLQQRCRPVSTEKVLASYVNAFRLEMPETSNLSINGSQVGPNSASSTGMSDREILKHTVMANERLREENVKLLFQCSQTSRGAMYLQEEITRLQKDRAILQEEANRLERVLQEYKQVISNQVNESISELKAEVENRGAVLDKKRAELAESKIKIEALTQQLHEKDELLSALACPSSKDA
jgi:Glycosyl transferase family 2